MKTKWNEMDTVGKVMLIVRMITSIVVVVLASLQLFEVWDHAINLAAPLLGVVLLIQSIQEWKSHRSVAIFGLWALLR